MAFPISKPIFIISLLGATTGGAIVLKDYLGGEPYNKILDASDKVVVVTGATSGIGEATAIALAKLNAKVIMACRDIKRCEEIRETIVLETRNKYVYCRKCDLASQKSIRAFAERIKKEHNKINILINNAGVMECPRQVTEDGIEMQLGVNYLGHFLLTQLLLDKLKESAPSRIIMLSDIAYQKGSINKSDFNSEKDYDRQGAYRQSKLADMMFVRELDKRLQGSNVTVNAVYPGVVDTELVRHLTFYSNFWVPYFVKPFLWPFIKSPRQGALAVLYAALDPELKHESGKCFRYNGEETIADVAKDDKTSHWLWLVSEKWTHLNKSSELSVSN